MHFGYSGHLGPLYSGWIYWPERGGPRWPLYPKCTVEQIYFVPGKVAIISEWPLQTWPLYPEYTVLISSWCHGRLALSTDYLCSNYCMVFYPHIIFVATTAWCYAIARPHDAMLHTCDGAFKRGCDASKSRAMCCDKKLNMLNILVPILEYLSRLLCD